VLGLLLILCVMYLPNGLASLWQRKAAVLRGHGHE
jgi:branched-chain amino acid transport system permease protein